jgi:flagellar hook-basal body complex protein FliE
MMTDISKIAGTLPRLDRATSAPEQAPAGGSFKDVLGGFLKEVNDLQLNVDDTIKKFAAGEIKDVHQVMIAAEEADIAFQLMMKIRTKLLKAYDEVMKMQV